MTQFLLPHPNSHIKSNTLYTYNLTSPRSDSGDNLHVTVKQKINSSQLLTVVRMHRLLTQRHRSSKCRRRW